VVSGIPLSELRSSSEYQSRIRELEVFSSSFWSIHPLTPCAISRPHFVNRILESRRIHTRCSKRTVRWRNPISSILLLTCIILIGEIEIENMDRSLGTLSIDPDSGTSSSRFFGQTGVIEVIATSLTLFIYWFDIIFLFSESIPCMCFSVKGRKTTYLPTDQSDWRKGWTIQFKFPRPLWSTSRFSSSSPIHVYFKRSDLRTSWITSSRAAESLDTLWDLFYQCFMAVSYLNLPLYFRHISFSFRYPCISRHDFQENILIPIYSHIPPSLRRTTLSHSDIGILFIIFAIATLVDLQTIEYTVNPAPDPYAVSAQYHLLARGALAAGPSIIQKPTISSIRCVVCYFRWWCWNLLI